MSKSKQKRLRIEAEKIAARKAIEQEFARTKDRPKGLLPGALNPKPTSTAPGQSNPPGYYGRGALRGAVYTNHQGKARA